jgi:hypothetical protein
MGHAQAGRTRLKQARRAIRAQIPPASRHGAGGGGEALVFNMKIICIGRAPHRRHAICSL